MNYEEAKFKAVRYLSLTKRTEYEVYNRLEKYKVDKEIIEKVIQYLKSIGYIDDKKYVEAFVNSNMKLLKYSIYEISYKLKIKGIKDYDMCDKLEFLSSNQYEEKVTAKIMNSKSKLMDKVSIEKYLYRRGFRKFGNKESD